MYEKPPAVLTKAHREYLLGDREYDRKNQERALRSSIRERVRAGILDFVLLYEYLEKEDRDQIFEPLKGAEYDPLVTHFNIDELSRALKESKSNDDNLPEVLTSLTGNEIELDDLYGENRELDRERVEQKIFAMEFSDALFSLLGFVYLGTVGTPVPFDEKVKAAIYQATRDHLGRYVAVDVEINEQKSPEMVEAALTKYNEGRLDEMEYEEMAALLEYHKDTIGDLGLDGDAD